MNWLRGRQGLLAWVTMGLIVVAGFSAVERADDEADQQRDAIAAEQRRLDQVVDDLSKLAQQVAAESEHRGVAGCKAIVTIRNALVGASAANDQPQSSAEQRQRAEGLAAFDALLQPALDDLCPDSGIKLGG